MRNITIDGNLGKNAEVRTTKEGKKYVKFSIANKIFEGGEEKVEWFDVVCYDQYVAETQSAVLTKGAYVIVSGTFRCDVSVKNDKCYLNQYVQAYKIDRISMGGKKSSVETEEEIPSTLTGATKTYIQETTPTPPVSSSVEKPVDDYDCPDDDLPF